MARTIKKQPEKKAEQGLSKGMKIAIAAVAAVLLVCAVMVIVEMSMKGKISAENDTTKNISQLKVYFEDADGVAGETIFDAAVPAGEKVKLSYEEQDMTAGEYTICFEVTFEGKKAVWMYDGDFNMKYNDLITMRFYEEKGELCMHATAGTGIFRSTTKTDVNTDFYIYPDEEDWNYK